jgi:rod shape-determining protein MreD
MATDEAPPMTIVRYVAGLLIALLAHAAGVWAVPEFARAVDLFLVLTVLYGLRGHSLGGLSGGLAAGLVQDALTAGPFGLHGFANTLVGYGVARLTQRVVVERPSGVLLVTAAASLVQQAVLASLALLLLPDRELPQPMWIGIRALGCGVIATLVFIATQRWRTGAETRRLTRGKPLRL